MPRKCVADIEANGFLEVADKIWCMVFKDIETKEVFKFHNDQEIGWEERCMEFMDNLDTLIMHNGVKYDWPLMEKLWGYTYKGHKVDTLVISRLHKPDRYPPKGLSKGAGPHSIEAWGLRLGRGKPVHEEWDRFSEEMLYRCEEDVEITLKVYNYLMREGRGYNWGTAYNMSTKLFEYIGKQEQYGWLADEERIKRYIAQLERWMGMIDRVLEPYLPVKLVIEEGKEKGKSGRKYIKKPFLKSGAHAKSVIDWFNRELSVRPDYDSVCSVDDVCGPFSRIYYRNTDINSLDECKQFLLNDGWEPKDWNYKKDPVTKRFLKDANGEFIKTSPKLSDKDPFIGVSSKVGKLVAKRVQVRHRKSSLEGYLALIREDGRISGRISTMAASYRMIHGGIVNVPKVTSFFGKQMRSVFSSKEGFTLIGTDAKSCQDRMLAERGREQSFTDMLLKGDKSKGTDGHSLATKAVNTVMNRHNLKQIIRDVGKNFNFAFKFGARDPKLGEMVNQGPQIGGEIREELRKVFHAQATLVDKLTEEWRSNAKKTVNRWGKVEYHDGWISGLDGRPIFIKYEYMILVYMLQSDEAIYMANVYCEVYERLCEKYKWGEDFGIVCFYHDEITVEIREEYAEEASLIIKKCFDTVSERFNMTHCPQEGEPEIGKNWKEIH